MRFPVQPLWSIASINDEVLPDSTDPSFRFEYVDISSVSRGEVSTDVESIEFGSAPSRARRLARQGDVIVSTVRTYLRAIASVGRSKADRVYSTGFAVLRPRAADPGYFRYALLAEEFIGEVVARSVGVSYPAINSSELMRLAIPSPPLDTQRRIADFLDRETAEIDSMDTDLDRLIDTLQERRLNVIDHYMEEVRDKACFAPLWTIAEVRPSNVDKKVRQGQPRVRLVNYTDVYYNARITRDLDLMVATANESEIERFGVHPGDVIITKDSETADDIGVPALVESSESDMVCGYHLTLIRPDSKMLLPDFLYWLIASPAVMKYWELRSFGVTRHSLNLSVVRRLPVPVVPLSEQRRIADRLDRETAEIDSMIEDARRLKEVLAERRSVLISDVVTGRKEVPA